MMKNITKRYNVVLISILAILMVLIFTTQCAFAEATFKVPEGSAKNTKTAVGATEDIYVSTLRTKTKAYIRWKSVKNADGYYLYKKSGSEYKRIATTTNRSVFLKSLSHTNYFGVRAYRYIDGKKVVGNMHYEKVVMPSVITPQTSGYTNTYGYKVIKKAKSKYGARYVWGASGPTVFDCSGFTCWTMKNSGVSDTWIPRYSSRTLYSCYNGRYGIGRNLSNAQSGDILIIGYNGSAKRIFHVGIYDCNGYYVHANGKKVTRSLVPRSMVVGIIRLKGLQ